MPGEAAAVPAAPRADVLTAGEAMLRLSAPSGARLGTARLLDVHVAGSEANVAAGLAQLGVPVRWISRLPTNPLGRRVERELADLGVLTDAVEWADERSRVGLFFSEPGVGTRPTTVLYDRRDSAFAGLSGLPEGIARGVRLVHVSGITPALGSGPAALVAALASAAATAGMLLSVDVNYRSRLWSPSEARRGTEPLLARADVIVCAERDARTVFELNGEADDVLTGLAALAEAPRLVVLTQGAAGCVAVDSDDGRHELTAPSTPVVDRFGMGDALVAGVLWGVLRSDVALGLRAGVELAAFKASLHGDLLRLEPGELMDLLTAGGAMPEVIR